MPQIPTLTQAMTPFPYSVESGQKIVEAGKLMEEHGIRHLPVKDAGKLVGVVSERDLRVATAAKGDAAANVGLVVGTVCSLNPYVVDIGEPLSTVVQEMATRQLSSALVVKHDKLVGIVTATDACRLLGELLTELSPRDDDVA